MECVPQLYLLPGCCPAFLQPFPLKVELEIQMDWKVLNAALFTEIRFQYFRFRNLEFRILEKLTGLVLWTLLDRLGMISII